MNINEKFIEEITKGNIHNAKLMMQNEKLDPACLDNLAIKLAARDGHYELIKLLLKDERVDPTHLTNIAIKLANKHKFYNIVCLLWNDKRVKNSLENDDKNLYNKLIAKDNIERF